MWTVDSDSEPASHAGSHYAGLLSECLLSGGMVPRQELWPGIRQRIVEHGDVEWAKLGPISIGIETAKARKLLGSGYVVTEFLMDAAVVFDASRDALCSAGALFNLAVVACDRLLEQGSDVGDVLASFHPGVGERRSPVDDLMRQYWQAVYQLDPGEKLVALAHRASGRIYEAEARTVDMAGNFPYRFWLRKSAVPFVLMGLPACTGRRYLNWLYRFGQFFGAVDDIVDYANDMEKDEPNILRIYRHEERLDLIRRVVRRGGQVLEEWVSLVPRTNEFAIRRESFLYFVWNWIGAAASAAVQA